MHSITVLGAYGSNSVKGGSTAFMLNDENVIDAGNLLLTLAEKSVEIESVWLTHSHLDHIIDMAYIVDNYYDFRTKTLKIYGLKETLDTVQKHFFNNKVWPDFSQIPLANGEGMTISYHAIEAGTTYDIGEEETVEPFLTDHSVPSCGYVVQKQGSEVIITADTFTLHSMIERLRGGRHIKTLVVECSFPSRMEALAVSSKHMTPTLLFKALEPLDSEDFHLYINHLKPTYEVEIAAEIYRMKGSWDVTILKDGDAISF